ncbi:tRNA endonuclease ANKZF1 [Neosynchiropus ocellatus]
MTSGAHLRSVFDFAPHDEALTGLREVNLAHQHGADPELPTEGSEHKAPDDDDGDELEPNVVREVSDRMLCSACRCTFISREEQLEHYKLDWHRFNLRLKISGLTPVTAEEFEKKSGAGDMSSISGSESDSDEEESDDDDEREVVSNVVGGEDTPDASVWSGRPSSKVVFLNAAGQYISVLRCILHRKPEAEQDLVSSLRSITKNTVWVVLMTGGGHFAAAVFQGREVIQHKTFHRYTVRAKRGTAQSVKDSQSRSHAPKSVGAALRRYNEAALVKDIQDLLTSWSTHLSQASAIFIRAPSYNKSMFFGGRTAPLDRKDARIRSIPFATRRATFREVRRVHDVLSSVQVYGKDTDLSVICSAPKKEKKKTVKATVTDKTEVDRESSDAGGEEEEEEEEGGIQLELVEMTLCTLDLRESEVYPGRSKKRRRKKKKENQKQKENVDDSDDDAEGKPSASLESVNKSQDEEPVKQQAEDESREFGLRDTLFTACKVGDVELLRGLLSPSEENRELTGSSFGDPSSLLTLLNKPVDLSGFTLLHVASAAAQKSVVRLLLETGADPALRNNKGQTPYIVAPDKDTRNVFRKYRGENPDRYDYNKAQVPEPLTAETESKKAEKKKAQKALKKQREKDQKEEKRKQESEAEEKKRFASLSDREKRALAAERRLAEQASATGVSVSNIRRCWTCGESLLGKVPFQYLDFSFCTPRCVQAHRKASAPAGKG